MGVYAKFSVDMFFPVSNQEGFMKLVQNHKVKFKSFSHFYTSFHYSKVDMFSKVGKISWFSYDKGGG